MRKGRKVLYLFIFAVLAVNIYRLYIEYRWDNLGFDDHSWIWNECRVAFWGYSPYRALANNQAIHGIAMQAHISTLPWGLLLGTLMHGAFLPYEASCIWYTCIRVMLVIATAVLVFRYLQKENVERQLRWLAMVSIPATWYAIDCISKANNGEIVCLLIISAICIIDEHPVVAGICMTFAMFKPQTALPFFVLFLILKKYRTILTSMAGVFICWGVGAVWTHENPVEQLQGVMKFANGMEASYHVVGIMDPLRRIGIGNSTAMLLSMVTGMLIMSVCLWILQHRYGLQQLVKKHAFFVYAFPAVTSVMWCYKSAQDYLILLIAAFAMYELWEERQDFLQFVFVIFVLGAVMTKPFSSALLGRLPMLDMYMCNRLDLLLKTLVMPMMVIIYIRREKWSD